MLDNYLSAEALIIQRIKDQVPGLNAVLSADDLAGVEERSQVAPAVHVLYGGDILAGGAAGSAGRGAARIVRQRWFAVIVVRQARDATGSRARAEAGPLISKVLVALSGWPPSAAHRELVRLSAPNPLYRAGMAYFPLAFETQLNNVTV